MWDKQQIVHHSYKTYDTRWLRETTLWHLLTYVVGNACTDARMTLDNAKFITIDVVEHIDEVSSSGGKRKRILGRTYATNLLDKSVYEIMNDCSTREFIFVVKPVEIPEGNVEVVNVFTVLKAAQCRTTIVISPPRNTLDNTVDDILHNDILL